MTKKLVKPSSQIVQICIKIRVDQKESLEKIREKTGADVTFQIKAAIDDYLTKRKNK